MTIYDWSTTPATNSSAATGINWAEGQAPSTVNDSARAMMADVATWRNAVGVQGAGRNIAARTNSSTPNTKIDITADAICVRDTSGSSMVLSTVSGTIDFGTVGANGIDTGTQVLSTWYYGWVIAKADGTVALLGSASATAPTMPSGYTFKALITAARSDASVHFVKYRQFGNEIFYETSQSALSGGSSATEASVSFTTLIPPNALAAQLFANLQVAVGGAAGSGTVRLRFVTSSDYIVLTQGVTTSSNEQQQIAFTFPNVGQAILYIVSIGGSASGATIDILVLGFKLPMGGE